MGVHKACRAHACKRLWTFQRKQGDKYKVSFFKGSNPAKGRGFWRTSRQALASRAASKWPTLSFPGMQGPSAPSQQWGTGVTGNVCVPSIFTSLLSWWGQSGQGGSIYSHVQSRHPPHILPLASLASSNPTAQTKHSPYLA